MKPAMKAALSNICLMYIGVSCVWNKKTFCTTWFEVYAIREVRADEKSL
jgi:hypothetical protein